MVEPVAQQFLIHLRSPLEGGHMMTGKGFEEEFFQYLGSVLTVPGWLEDNAVSCGQSTDQGCDTELEWIIPRTHDQHHAFWLGNGVCLGRK
ncbi:hypothetical protein SDC9_106578 [bioreactor metagenome]|uniref:Uncharacterized protein n=1 Tax=bioreactor metagenome TaxID=1076179 RepID=A0A645B2R4_9ZZZZ